MMSAPTTSFTVTDDAAEHVCRRRLLPWLAGNPITPLPPAGIVPVHRATIAACRRAVEARR